MQVKVKNEAGFQILTSAMSIGPSQTGYVLEVSADGKNFSPLFAVAANTTKMATGLAPNAYYRLKGNVGEVIVNWSRSCVTEGGGAAGNELIPQESLPATAEAGTVVALTNGGVYQYDGTNWNEVGGADMSAYWTSAETQSAITAVEDHLFDVEEVTASAYTELHDDILELSARTVDLSPYYTSAQTEDAILAKHYITSAQAETQIVEKNYITSADTADMVTSTFVSTIWKGTQEEYDAITTKDPNTFYIIVSN